jgi:hypothetical protein
MLRMEDRALNMNNSVIGVFPDHLAAEAAVKQLTAAGLAIKSLTIVGKGYHTDEKVVGFYNTGDRIKFWGSRGAFWGGLWGLFFGGLFLTVPIIGPVVVLGYLATTLISALEGAVVFGGLGVLGGALSGIGVPENSVLEYHTVLAADNFLVMVHGSADEIRDAEAVLRSAGPTHLAVHGAAVPDQATGTLETVG